MTCAPLSSSSCVRMPVPEPRSATTARALSPQRLLQQLEGRRRVTRAVADVVSHPAGEALGGDRGATLTRRASDCGIAGRDRQGAAGGVSPLRHTDTVAYPYDNRTQEYPCLNPTAASRHNWCMPANRCRASKGRWRCRSSSRPPTLTPARRRYDDVRYLRSNNTPSQLALHAKLAALEGAEAALVSASGMASICTTLLDSAVCRRSPAGAELPLWRHARSGDPGVPQPRARRELHRRRRARTPGLRS